MNNSNNNNIENTPKDKKDNYDNSKVDIDSSNKTQNTIDNKKEMKTKKTSTRRNIVLIILLIVLIAGYVMFRGNYLEIKEIGDNYLDIFWQNTAYTAIILAVNFIFLFCAFYFTNKTIRKGLKVFFDDEKKEMPKFPNKSISFIIAMIGSIVSTNIFLNKIFLCLSNSKVGINDSIFRLDISYFMFQKPLIQFMLIYLLVVVVATLAYAIIYSLIVLNISFDGVSRESITKCNLVGRISSRVKMIAVIAGLIVVFFMVNNIGNEKFMSVELNDGTKYSIYGAGTVDATVKLCGYIILAIITTISILKAYKALKEKSLRRVIGNAMVVPVYLIALAIVLALYQLIFIGPNEIDKNQKYIAENIKNTKAAYGISAEEQNINYSGTITEKDIEDNSNQINNIAIVTSQNVLQDLETSQTSKGYYTYRSTQIENYNINGKPSLVYITPREILNSNTTYANKTYQYTHGYGSIVTKAGSTDEYGNLNNTQKGFGDTENENEIPIKEPRIYFGLETNDVVVINSKKAEFDYPDEETNKEVEYSYNGNAGLNLNLLDRLILGIKEGDLQLAFSGSITSNSKIITNRNIINRAKTILPYLKYDTNPYVVINDSGEQYWVLDAYTTSNEYPFSQKTQLTDTEEINYIRNSVKVIVNAYDGTMKFYITYRTDPIAMAYNNIYPTLFAQKDEQIPSDISKHFVYPEYLYKIQSKMVEKYHNIEPEVLYRGNDIWQLAETISSGKATEIKPYYTMVKDSSGNDTLGIITPYTLYNKQNISSYMVGTCENGSLKLKIYTFPSDSNVLGPIQLETQINQDETIASEIASLNVTGTKLTKNIIAVPINNTILYVETIYQQLINETTQKPTLKRVVVASGNKVAIGNNLEGAIQNLLSKHAVNIDVSNNENKDDLIKSIIKANQNTKASSKSNDWKLFGEDMQKLTTLIDQLENVIKTEEQKQANEASINGTNTVTSNIINETNSTK